MGCAVWPAQAYCLLCLHSKQALASQLGLNSMLSGVQHIQAVQSLLLPTYIAQAACLFSPFCGLQNCISHGWAGCCLPVGSMPRAIFPVSGEFRVHGHAACSTRGPAIPPPFVVVR